MGGDQTQDAIESANSQWIMIWHGYALMRWGIGLENDMATFLIDHLVPPVPAKHFDQAAPVQIARDLHPNARTSSRTR